MIVPLAFAVILGALYGLRALERRHAREAERQLALRRLPPIQPDAREPRRATSHQCFTSYANPTRCFICGERMQREGAA